MPFNYVTVAASSDLFTPATRAFGDILIIGKGAVGSSGSAAQRFTDPATAAEKYPMGATKLVEKSEANATAVSVAAEFPTGTEVVVGKDSTAEVRTVKSVAVVATKVTLTLDKELKNPHPVDDPVVGHGTSDLAAAISTAFAQTRPPPWSGASNWPPPTPPGPPRSRPPWTSPRRSWCSPTPPSTSSRAPTIRSNSWRSTSPRSPTPAATAASASGWPCWTGR